MRLSFLPFVCFFAFLAVPSRVAACEGECIVGITDAFCGLYQPPVEHVLLEVIRTSFSIPDFMVGPVMKSYRNNSYTVLENAIFPSYFHGKCQVNGVDPAGCPNPDCPVVCGTPGSLVHFYFTLLGLVHDAVVNILVDALSPGSVPYAALEKTVSRQATGPGPRMLRYKRSMPTLDGKSSVPLISKRENLGNDVLRNAMNHVGPALDKFCGGRGDLPLCSWEKPMKELILSYP
ncbi:hypothetical protein B0H10DRAFT_2165495 [Mycena sp. CBHHK59/15]|nr:hypothetical protein B0H10DRAFT_2165495 [Mycena sp. CBHHK59/15]